MLQEVPSEPVSSAVHDSGAWMTAPIPDRHDRHARLLGGRLDQGSSISSGRGRRHGVGLCQCTELSGLWGTVHRRPCSRAYCLTATFQEVHYVDDPDRCGSGLFLSRGLRRAGSQSQFGGAGTRALGVGRDHRKNGVMTARTSAMPDLTPQ